MSCKKTGMYFYMMGKYPLFIEILHFFKTFFFADFLVLCVHSLKCSVAEL